MNKRQAALDKAKKGQSKYMSSVKGEAGEMMRGIPASLRRAPAKKY